MSRLDHVIVWVNDLARARRFYTDVLGMPVRFETDGFVAVGEGESWIGLHPTESDGDDIGRGSFPYLRVDDLDAELARLAEQGVTPHRGPHDVLGGRIATILDSEGNAVGLYQAPAAH